MSKFPILNKRVIGWALYDWANSAFALSVLAVLFPLVLGNYWSVGDDGSAVTARLGWITFAASVIVCVTAPLFGTIADAGGYRKRFLFVLAVVGATMTAALGFVGKGEWPLALGVYLLASIGYYSSVVFYDSLLIDVCEPRYYSFVSTLGFSLGYLGGAVLLALHVWMLSSPATFGFADTAEVFSFAFVSVGAWWLIFLLPLLFFVHERHSPLEVRSGAIRAAYAELKATALKVGQYRNIVVFLTGYWLYIGGVFTVIFMAVNYGQRLGFDDKDLVMALLITNFIGFPATLLYGFVAHRVGPKSGIYFALLVYIGMSAWAIFMTEVWQFYVMAMVIGTVQGGVQGLSRSLYASLIPPELPGEFFGFYNMVTKFAHVLGPAMVATAAMLSDDPKWVLLTLMPLFLAGALLLSLVRTQPPEPTTR
ncbi:MAG: MFS transporter [Gammaproteobacteria bacterium]|nr:MFS transporter [Gammaproteobacteria bacterium]